MSKNIAIKVHDKLYDLSEENNFNDNINYITINDEDGVKILRHSLAHVMAAALKQIDPNIKFAIGPAIEHGFYYDIQSDKQFSIDDLESLENIMKELIKNDLKFSKSVITKQKAIEHFKKLGQDFKVEIIENIEDDTVSMYQVGDFLDLCRGPHLPSTKFIPIDAFKLTKVAGAYWRGDSSKPMLQRIYGIAFANKKQLNEHLKMLEEAKLRDHRKLGQELELFHLDDVAPGNVFWLPNGNILFNLVKDYIASVMKKYNYRLVKTPQLLNKSLWETSGHWGKFKENMFIVDDEETTMAIKPMNCPGHIICYKTGAVKSYRDLPLRIGEFGICHRNESSGSLHGIMRLRCFMQDDGHIFCAPDQIVSETVNVCSMLKEIYSKFGFNEIKVKFSDRPNKRVGSDEIWDLAESSLKNAADKAGLEYTLNKGEGAFYGPKLEFVLKDCLGREWQCGTLQVDFNLPERFDIHYTDNEGQKHHPVMLHRAIVGSIERFIGILIENYNGNFPFWLSPCQIAIVTVSQKFDQYANSVYNMLTNACFRVQIDSSAETLMYKIRKYSKLKIPKIIVLGQKEIEENSIGVRSLGSNNTETILLNKAIEYFNNL
ncbi:MAG: threonine--tRNA ligase [Alphaproteobacteria bacterium]|nr:threonine--tRNA ligase [Alphaproteobacteria bacterium]